LLLGSGEAGPTVTWLEQQDELLTVREAAAILKVSRATVYTLVERGELVTIRLGNSIRIPRQALSIRTRP
jgi:excisionase family DNA binding protein